MKSRYSTSQYCIITRSNSCQRYTLFHRLIKFVLNGRIYTGPFKETLQFGMYRKVLDIGTGNGEWAIELADELSYVYVTGVDTAPIQYRDVPPRCRFEIWDANVANMPYEDAYFDVIHARAIHTGIHNYPAFLSEIARMVRPGGLVLLIEPGMTQYAQGKPESEFTSATGPVGWFKLWETYRYCLSSAGIDPSIPEHLHRLLEATNQFEDIEYSEITIPIGFYPQHRRSLTIGELQWMAYDLLLPALKPMFLNCGLNKSRTDELIKNATVDLYHGNTIFELSSRLYIVNAKRKNI
ncbi:S-adenosyl-L-methionine-dependent methyltransferase [Mycena olivaceomarginata]|nr:S-adenosyl-L-methionine-dependent methyltransferase [Mycena olivaceomarginata]